jgi:hypothetical protein
LSGALAAAEGIAAVCAGTLEVRSLQEIHAAASGAPSAVASGAPGAVANAVAGALPGAR